MVAAVVDGGADDDHSQPKPGHSKVRPGHYWTGNHWAEIDNKLLEWMAIDRSHAHWSCPLVVCFVDVLIELWMVKKSASERVVYMQRLKNVGHTFLRCL